MNLSVYTAAVAGLLRESKPMPLVRLSARGATAEILRSTAPNELFPDARHPEAALAGLWLRLGDWDKAHDIAQDVPSAEGSYWHAIIHRQEPDVWNSGYWFRRVGRHLVFAPLQRAAAELAISSPDAGFTVPATWQPEAFTEFCAGPAAARGSKAETLALAIQDAEWWLLFNWCAGVSQDIA